MSNLPRLYPSISLVYQKPFEAMNQKKLKDETEKSIIALIARICSLISIRPEYYPSTDQAKLIIDVLLKNYSYNTTAEEILLAFEYYVIGKIQVDKEHFGILSSEFICACVNAYKKQVKSELIKLISFDEEKKRNENKPVHIPTDDECYSFMDGFYEKHNKAPIACNWWVGCFNYLEKNLIINMKDEEKEALMNELLQRELENDENRAFKRAIVKLKEKKILKKEDSLYYIISNIVRNIDSTDIDKLILKSKLELCRLEARKITVMNYFNKKYGVL